MSQNYIANVAWTASRRSSLHYVHLLRTLFQPQAYRCPESSAATVCRHPPDMRVIRTPLSASTALGTVRSLPVTPLCVSLEGSLQARRSLDSQGQQRLAKLKRHRFCRWKVCSLQFAIFAGSQSLMQAWRQEGRTYMRVP